MSTNKEFKNISLLATDEVEGKVEAVFSIFNEIDSDGDVVLPDSIKSGYGDRGVAMVWGHDWKDVIGRGEIKQDGSKATFNGQFIMDTERGREAFNTVKAMGDLQQWSFGYEVIDSENGKFTKDGQETDVRYLKDLRVWEVSPVLVGANQNTHTLAVKNATQEVNDDSDKKRFTDEIDELRKSLAHSIERIRDLISLRLEKGKKLSEKSSNAIIELTNDIQEAYQDLDDMLNVGLRDELVVNKTDEDEKLIIETLRILAETSDV